MCVIKTYKKKYCTAILFYFFVNACYGSNLIFKEKLVYNKESLENTVKIIELR